MPLLALFIGGWFSSAFGAWADTLTRKAAIIAAAVASIAALTVAFVAAMAALVAALVPALPSGLGMAVWLFVPYTLPACLGVMFACDAACGVYAWSKGNIRLAAQVAA